MKEIQVFNQQKKEKSRVATCAADYTLAILRGLKLGAIFHPSVEMLTSFGTVIVVGFGGYLAINGILQVSDIVGFILYLNLFYQPISTLARVSEDLQQAVAGAERVYSILDTDPDIKDSPGAREIKRAEGKITFDRVYFHYVENIPVLTDVSFTAQAGQMVALVGPTGVGKQQ